MSDGGRLAVMKSDRWSRCAALALGAMLIGLPAAATAAVHTVGIGESIQAAIDAAAPGDVIKVLPGDYMEPDSGSAAAIRITKPLKLIARSSLPDGPKVRILPNPDVPTQRHGILVEPANPGDPDVDGVLIKGFTVEGFDKMGIWLRHVRNYKIKNNESINNLENGIFPTLSANGLVKKNVAYGSLDAALWVEASENVRVIKNEVALSPTGLEVTVSKNILIKGNVIHDNTVGLGLYHPSAASLPPLGGDGDWDVIGNHIYDNNLPNPAPPGSLSSELPRGAGVLLLGVDRVTMSKNRVENNDFIGLAVLDWCFGFDCVSNPPVVESAVDDNSFISNVVTGNGLNPDPGGFAGLATDILYLGGNNNCFSSNTVNTSIPAMLGPAC